MKTIFKTALCLSVLLLASSCVLDQIDSQPAAEPRLTCDALESYTVQAVKPQDISFSVSATTPWSVTGFENTPWVTVSPASSAESSLAEDIRIKTAENPETEERSVVLTIKGDNVAEVYTVTITQMRRGKLVVTPIAETDIFAAAGGAKTFELQSNIAWEAHAADEWLTLSPASGTSDGPLKSFSVTATAAKNTSVTRSTTVSVVAGDEKFEFVVNQQGQSFEFKPVDFTEVDRNGADLVLGVDATMDWNAECNIPEVKLTKDGNDKLLVSVPRNNRFAPRTVKITIKPVDASYAGVSSSLEFTQDIIFSFEGNYEVLSDGSIKIMCGAKSKVKTIDAYRYVNIVLKFGEKHFGSKGELWCAVNANGCNIYNQLSLGGNLRIRQDGNLPVTKKPDGADVSTYENVKYSFTQDQLNAMDEYRFEVVNTLSESSDDYPGVYRHVVNFWYNGAVYATMNYRSVFADDPTAAGNYWFGFYNSTSDDTWYVVKSCDVIPYAE